MTEVKTDVFIAGAGPTGLVLAYQLNRLGVSTYIIDAADKASPDMPMYGRASTLLPRTLELLDQLDLFDDLAQEALFSNRGFTYRNGERVFGRGWGPLHQLPGTSFPYTLNLRLKYSEDIFRERLAEQGSFVQAPLKLVDFRLDEHAGDDYRVSATCERPGKDRVKVKAKYIVGADGGRSTVRKLAEIPFPGSSTNQHWVRIDGVIKTNIPEARAGFGAFESQTHGHVLFVAIDHSATRIGYVLTKEMFDRYGFKMTQEEAEYEAQLACAPFDVKFERVDWYTVYGVQQRVAERFVDRQRIVLVGDAGHTHSSGTAQGMNTGMHDVVNLGWRLAGTINGWYKPGVLEGYSDERHATAETLINNDKIISMLISGERPEGMEHRQESTNVLLKEFFGKIREFSTGLGVSYEPNLVNHADLAFAAVNAYPGTRCPDVRLQKPGILNSSVRLHEVTKNNGKFKVIVFTAKVELTRPLLEALRSQVDEHQSQFAHAVEFLTVIEGTGQAFEEHLGMRKFGRAYWDNDSNAHWAFGLGDNIGALTVVRPDGVVCASAALDGFAETLVPYFDRIIISRDKDEPAVNSHRALGELMIDNENSLSHSKNDRIAS